MFSLIGQSIIIYIYHAGRVFEGAGKIHRRDRKEREERERQRENERQSANNIKYKIDKHGGGT